MLRTALILFFLAHVIFGFSQSKKWLQHPEPEFLSLYKEFNIDEHYRPDRVKLFRLPCYSLSTKFINYKGEKNIKPFLKPTNDVNAFLLIHDTLIMGHISSRGSLKRYRYSSVGISHINSFCFIKGIQKVMYNKNNTSIINVDLPWTKDKWLPVNKYFNVKGLIFALKYLDKPFRDSLQANYEKNGINNERLDSKTWDSIKNQSVKHVKEHQFIKKILGEAFLDTVSYNFRIIPTFRISDRIFDYTIYEDIRMMLESDTLSLSLIFHNDTHVIGHLHKELYHYKVLFSVFQEPATRIITMKNIEHQCDVDFDYFYVIGLGLYVQKNNNVYSFKWHNKAKTRTPKQEVKNNPRLWFETILKSYYDGHDDVFYEQLYNKKPGE